MTNRDKRYGQIDVYEVFCDSTPYCWQIECEGLAIVPGMKGYKTKAGALKAARMAAKKLDIVITREEVEA